MLIYSGKITKNVNPIKPRKKRHKIITKCSQKVEKKEKYGMIKIRTENYY